MRFVHTVTTESILFFPPRMDNIGLYEDVHMETCSNDNGNDVIIKWVLCPIVTGMATTLKINVVAIAAGTTFKLVILI